MTTITVGVAPAFMTDPRAVTVGNQPYITDPVDVSAVAVPTPGPTGPPGGSDAAIAYFLTDPDSASSEAVVDIVGEETDPMVDLTILFENALA